MNKKYLFLIVLAFVGFVFVGFVLAFTPITTFSNLLTSENLTFTGDENITRYLDIPRYANVTSAYLNLSGYLK